MAVVLQKVFNLNFNTQVSLKDIPKNHWAELYANALLANNISRGDGSGNYLGNDLVKREQYAEFSYNTILTNPEKNTINKTLDSRFSSRGDTYQYPEFVRLANSMLGTSYQLGLNKGEFIELSRNYNMKISQTNSKSITLQGFKDDTESTTSYVDLFKLLSIVDHQGGLKFNSEDVHTAVMERLENTNTTVKIPDYEDKFVSIAQTTDYIENGEKHAGYVTITFKSF